MIRPGPESVTETVAPDTAFPFESFNLAAIKATCVGEPAVPLSLERATVESAS